MIVRTADFLLSGLKAAHFPPATLPEVAFAGRSNVGKSSLINTLLGRRALVRTSRKPGQTRMLNFFLVNDDLMLVDLPGYGFSRAPKEVIRSYQDAMSDYVTTRKTLLGVILLLDVRRLPSKEDKHFLNLVRSCRLETLIVLTKADTLGRGSWKKAWSMIAHDLNLPGVDPIFFSAKTGEGREAIWAAIEERRKDFPITLKKSLFFRSPLIKTERSTL